MIQRALRTMAFLLLAFPFGAHAQTLLPGARVRIASPGISELAVGTVQGVTGGRVTLLLADNAGTIELTVSDATALELSRGHRRGRSAGIGGGVGSLVGVVGGTMLGAAEPSDVSVNFLPMITGLAGLVTGGVIGAVTGAVVAPESWQAMRLPDPVLVAGTPAAPPVLRVHDGTRVRLSPAEGSARFTGSARGTATGVSLRADDMQHSYAWKDIDRIEVRGGRDRGKGLAYGAAIGALVALIPGGIEHSRGAISTSALIGVAAGNTAVGMLVGALLAPRGWEPLPIPR